MRMIAALILAAVVAGCSGNGVPSPPAHPVNGQCGAIQDMCLMGTPTGTGDTSSPYGWMCTGRNGGAKDSCSVAARREYTPAARRELRAEPDRRPGAGRTPRCGRSRVRHDAEA